MTGVWKMAALSGAATLAFFSAIDARAIEISTSRAPVMARATEPVGTDSEFRTAWRGWIVSPRGRVFVTDGTMSDERSAKRAAKRECENAGGFTCSMTKSIAIPDTDAWVVSLLACGRGSRRDYFLGGSTMNGSIDKAQEKATQAGFRADQCSAVSLDTR